MVKGGGGLEVGVGAEPGPIGRDGREAEALDRYWDGLVRGGGVHPGGLEGEADGPSVGFDAGLAAAVGHLHAGDEAPAPSPAFATRLRRDLFGARVAEPGGTVAAMPGAGAGVGRSLGLVHPLLGWRSAGRAVAAVAAAIVLALVGGVDPHRLVPGLIGPTPTVAAEERMSPATTEAAGCVSTATPAGAAIDLPRLGVATATATAGGGQGCGGGR